MSTRPALSKWNHKRFENIDRRVEELGAQVEEQFSENGKKITTDMASILLGGSSSEARKFIEAEES